MCVCACVHVRCVCVRVCVCLDSGSAARLASVVLRGYRTVDMRAAGAALGRLDAMPPAKTRCASADCSARCITTGPLATV